MNNIYKYFTSFERIPGVPIVGYPGIVYLGMNTYEVLNNFEKHVKVVKFLVKEIDPDAALPLMDLTVEAEILGASVSFPSNAPPTIDKHLSIGEVKYDKNFRGRIDIYKKTANLMKSEVKIPVGFYVVGPLTVLAQVLGTKELMLKIFNDENSIKNLLEMSTEVVINYAKELLESKVDFIVIADPSSSLISLEHYEKFSKPFLRKLVNSIEVDFVLHTCGRSKHLLKSMVETGVSGISIDENVPLDYAVSQVPENTLVFGNISPSRFVLEKKETLEENIKRMLEPVKNKKNIVASTGCDIPPEAQIESIKSFMKVVKHCRRYNEFLH